MYEKMRIHLKTHTDNRALSPYIQNAAAAALFKLQEYYNCAKGSHYTILATILHPSLRLRWFKTLGADFEASACTIFKFVYDRYQEATPNPPPSTEATPPAPETTSFLSSLFNNIDPALLTEPTQPNSAPIEMEIDRYLNGEGGKGDLSRPLAWWKDHEGAFPTIARMARDILAIPATSVAVERVFSKSRHLCTEVRASFKAETITQAMCVKHWIRAGLLEVHSTRA